MFKIRMADLVIEIRNKFDYVEKQCKDYIVDELQEALVSVEATDEEIAHEKEVALYSFNEGYLESVCIYRNIALALPKYNAFLLHAAVVSVDSQGYAFTAKSGVGKSTHIKLWEKLFGNRLQIINGDKPIVRIVDGNIYAYGTPWCGKEGYNVNCSVPLKAICFLERGETDEIEMIDKSLAAGKIIHQVIVPKSPQDIVSVLSMLDNVIRNVDIWKLKCTMNISAAEVSYNAMKGGKTSEN